MVKKLSDTDGEIIVAFDELKVVVDTFSQNLKERMKANSLFGGSGNMRQLAINNAKAIENAARKLSIKIEIAT